MLAPARKSFAREVYWQTLDQGVSFPTNRLTVRVEDDPRAWENAEMEILYPKEDDRDTTEPYETPLPQGADSSRILSGSSSSIAAAHDSHSTSPWSSEADIESAEHPFGGDGTDDRHEGFDDETERCICTVGITARTTTCPTGRRSQLWNRHLSRLRLGEAVRGIPKAFNRSRSPNRISIADPHGHPRHSFINTDTHDILSRTWTLLTDNNSAKIGLEWGRLRGRNESIVAYELIFRTAIYRCFDQRVS
jgi:hypothetical protein